VLSSNPTTGHTSFVDLSESRASIPPVLSTTGKGRALTVDDEPHMTHSYSLCLVEMRLFEVDTYDDVLETLYNSKSNAYDLVLLVH